MNSDQSINIKLLKHKELKIFQEFINNHWQKDHIFAKENSVFDWQHKGTNEYHYMIANLKDSVVGVLGVTLLNHFDKYLTNNQVFLGLWKALEDKGIGIGIRLFKEILAKAESKNLLLVWA